MDHPAGPVVTSVSITPDPDDPNRHEVVITVTEPSGTGSIHRFTEVLLADVRIEASPGAPPVPHPRPGDPVMERVNGETDGGAWDAAKLYSGIGYAECSNCFSPIDIDASRCPACSFDFTLPPRYALTIYVTEQEARLIAIERHVDQDAMQDRFHNAAMQTVRDMERARR